MKIQAAYGVFTGNWIETCTYQFNNFVLNLNFVLKCFKEKSIRIRITKFDFKKKLINPKKYS